MALGADQLLDEARQQAGLEDYGDMTFEEGFRVLVKSANEESGLEEKYEAPLEREIVRVLVNRLRMNKDLSEHPEILDEVILPPVFITSMPRTGSTKLHRVLAATGAFNSLPFWMSYNFAPFPGDGEKLARIDAAEEYLQHMYTHAPLFQLAHPQYAEETEEELSLLDAGFNSLYRWAAVLHAPSYVNWVLESGGLQAFYDLRVQLQYIQWQHYHGMNRRWVLKTPSLFGFEMAYQTVLEGTDFIVTHRLPTKTWPSQCQLFCGVRGMYSDDDFADQATPVMIHNVGEAARMHLAWRDQAPDDKVLDVAFAEVMADEIAVTRKIFDFLAMEFTDAHAEGITAWLAMDAQRGHERSKATLADFNTDAATLEQAFAGYIERYKEFL